MPVDIRERCAYCLQDFTVFWEHHSDRYHGKPFVSSIPAVPIGDGLWLCKKHQLNEAQIKQLKEKIRRKETIQKMVT